jgi:hypothetical protein
MNRYDGKPFLRLLDSYVLDVIGQLETDSRSALERMQPRLAQTFGTAGTWQEIVRSQLELPDTFPAEVRFIWEGFLDQAKRQGLSVDPNEFVERFVSENFPGIFKG